MRQLGQGLTRYASVDKAAVCQWISCSGVPSWPQRRRSARRKYGAPSNWRPSQRMLRRRRGTCNSNSSEASAPSKEADGISDRCVKGIYPEFGTVQQQLRLRFLCGCAILVSPKLSLAEQEQTQYRYGNRPPALALHLSIASACN